MINSAGVVGPNKPLLETDPAAWERTFDVNVHGTFRVIQAVAPGMVDRGWGRIVNIASMAGKDGNPNLSAYSASKAAVIGHDKVSRQGAREDRGARQCDRAGGDRHPDERDHSPGVLAHITSLIPMGRVGTAAEVAALIAWLTSDECSFSTGAVYDISGGRATY